MRADRIASRLKAADEAAYVWLTSLEVGRSAWFCGGYGLGLAAMAVGPGGASESATGALSWLAIAGCLFLAGLAHDNERGSAASALPAPAAPKTEPGDLGEAAAPPFRRIPPELADMLYPDNRVAGGVQADIASARAACHLDDEDTQPSAK